MDKYASSDLHVSILSDEHLPLLNAFMCEEQELNDYLVNDALPYQNLHLGVTCVLLNKNKDKIISYVTLAMGSLKLPKRLNFQFRGKTLSDYPKIFPKQFPALLIGKLATDRSEEGKGGASFLIEHAVKIALSERGKIGCVYLVAHAIAKAQVTDWYAKKGFQTYADTRNVRDTVPMYVELP